MSLTTMAVDLTEKGVLPDAVVRVGIRRLLRQRLSRLHAGDATAAAEAVEAFVAAMDAAPVALVPELANAQHYEVPAAFFALALGAQRKYSSCVWPAGVTSLDEAEEEALRVTIERARLADGQRILELGCGWGSLTLAVAQRFPGSHVTAVSNSASQRAYIEQRAAERGLRNVTVLTADMNAFDAPGRFDRVVSVEMFEHMRNWRALFARVHRWLEPGGLFFMHVFVHRAVPYAFEVEGAGDWMSAHFFSGGMMPSDELAARFQDDLRLVRRWRWDGTHYARTAEAWLARLDANREAALALLRGVHGADDAAWWLQRWRVFFMACAELFGYARGQEWWVSHYLFERPARGAGA